MKKLTRATAVKVCKSLFPITGTAVQDLTTEGRPPIYGAIVGAFGLTCYVEGGAIMAVLYDAESGRCSPFCFYPDTLSRDVKWERCIISEYQQKLHLFDVVTTGPDGGYIVKRVGALDAR